MPTAEQIQQAIREVTDQRSFIDRLLHDTLGWPIELGFDPDIGDITYEWSDEELNAVGLSRDILSGPVLQMQSLEQEHEQPWGIFILEFAHEAPLVTGRGLTGPLRKVLRGLVPKRRNRQANLPAWNRDNLLFICTHNYQHFRFAYFKSPKEKGHAEPLTTFGWEPGIPPRTVCEFNLGHLEWPEDPSDADKWVINWSKAFDVEAVTKKFYEEYKDIYELLQEQIVGLDNEDDQKIFVQTVMNRLLFLRFVERKGWLKFDETQGTPQNYLQMLYQAGPVGNASWYNSRLMVLFFEGMAVHNHQKEEIIGQVPYLNGGLFEKDWRDDRVTDIPDSAFESILSEDGLFYRYNFTVEESTPLDIDVAVDPEMLGKAFEKLVIERREKGSYYTPRTVVSFMCRESLKGYIGNRYASLIDEHLAGDIQVSEARQLITKLDEVKVVDPACGSGAYLLGMLHELFDITKELDTRAGTESPHDAYQRKLKIIQNNLYGVDIDEFAINIARLRLWLSLAVEFEGDEPEPLPNLDFKIECGDSLVAPDPSGGIEPGLHRELMKRYVVLRSQYLNPPPTADKSQLLRIINELKENIIEWLHTSGPVEGFDWQVEFIEVFINGGFDIVLANPPYGVRVNDNLRNQYFNQRLDSEKGQSKDSYGIFLSRGLQLLRSNGTLSYIVSDTWRTIRTHRPLRKRLLETTTVFHILDLPSWIFEATVNTCVLTLKKMTAQEDHRLIAGDLRGLEKGDWKGLSDNLIAVSGHGPDIQTINCARYTYHQKLIRNTSNIPFFISTPKLFTFMNDMNSRQEAIQIGNEQINSRMIEMNGKEIPIVRLGQVAENVGGVKTYDNRRFVKSIHESGRYEIVQTTEITTELSERERNNGIPSSNPHFVEFDKSGEMISEDGFLIQYYKPCEFYIDWSEEAVQFYEENNGLRNRHRYFQKGITYSVTGIYAPTFREGTGFVFGQKGATIFCDLYSMEQLLGVLCSQFVRFLVKNFISHGVDTTDSLIAEIVFPANISNGIERLVTQVIMKQKENPRYNYVNNEQKEIDQLVFNSFGLIEDDIREVELWYCRRYPKLAEAQGALAEVKEKYADHLARCQRILEKPPSYWRSNPILELIAQGESQTLEFKEALEYSVDTRQRSADVLQSSLKTIAGFLNADGGTLLIGISDSGEVKGLQRDFRCMGRIDRDRFELHIRNYLRDRFAPTPVGKVNISFEELAEGTVCRVDVQACEEIIHLDDEVYVRDGNRTQKLEGRALTEWIQRRTK
ncbi:MAG: Eco57I restriction-modification methylase domain-containing protein [Candidatus Hodarchaeota archaeon]